MTGFGSFVISGGYPDRTGGGRSLTSFALSAAIWRGEPSALLLQVPIALRLFKPAFGGGRGRVAESTYRDVEWLSLPDTWS